MENYVVFIHKYAKAFFWLIFFGVNLALFIPSIGEQGEMYNLDTIVHYLMFLALASSALNYWGKAPVTLIAIALFIPSSEVIQEMFIPGRGYEFTDILSGFAGILSGLLAYTRFLWYEDSRHQRSV